MNTESHPIQRAEQPGDAVEAGLPARAQPAFRDPPPARRLRWATRLKGRWRWPLLLAIFGAGLGATFGYYCTRPMYRAASAVVIKPITFDLKPVGSPLATSVQGSGDPAPEGSRAQWLWLVITDGVQRQAEALQDPALLAAAFAGEMPANAEASLRVAVDEGALGRLRVAWLDRDPALAEARLRQVLRAYEQSPAYRAAQRAGERAMDQWAKREVALQAKAQALEQSVALRGADTLDTIAAEAGRSKARLEQIEAQVASLRFALASLHEAPEANTDLRLTDQQQAALRAERDRLAAPRAGEQAPATADDQPAADSGWQSYLQKLRIAWIDHRLQQAHDAEPRAAVRLTADGVVSEQLLTAEQCRGRLRELTALANTARVSANAAASRLAEARRLAARIDQHHHEAAQVEQVLARLASEPTRAVAEVENVITSSGQPYRDDRVAYAALGAGVGLGLGFVGALLVVLGNDRMRPEDEPVLVAARAPLLGALPDLLPEHATRADADHAAMSMHQMRARLESLAEAHDQRAFAVVSAEGGVGKTSVSVGLAASLATAGHRVLLIDGDLTGRRNPTDPDAAAHPGLDQVLQEMGHLPRQTAELFVADHTRTGLLGALRGLPLAHCVVETRIAGLDALPALGARPEHASRLSGKSIRRLIAASRSRYDYVLLDSGRVPGGVETLLLASNADGVLMVIDPSQRQRGFDRAMSQLRLVGAHIIGTVFNRAHDRAKHQRAAAQDHSPWRPSDLGSSGSGIFAAAIDTQSRDLPELSPAKTRRTPRPKVNPVALPDPGSNVSSAPENHPVIRSAGGTRADAPATPLRPRAFPELDTDSHRVLGDTVDRLVQDTIALAMRQRRLRDRGAKDDRSAPAPAATDEPDPLAEVDAPTPTLTPEIESAESPPHLDVDADQLAREIDSMLESARDRDA